MDPAQVEICDNVQALQLEKSIMDEPKLPENSPEISDKEPESSQDDKSALPEQEPMDIDKQNKEDDESASTSVCSTQDKGGGENLEQPEEINPKATDDDTELNKVKETELIEGLGNSESKKKDTEVTTEDKEEEISEISEGNDENVKQDKEDTSELIENEEPMSEAHKTDNEEENNDKNGKEEQKHDESTEEQKNDENEKPDSEISSEIIENEERDTTEGNETEKSCDIEMCEDSSQSNNNKDTAEDAGETTAAPIFMDIDTNKDDDKEDNDKPTTETDQDEDVDPIGESTTEWSAQATAETEEAECIIPDNRQEERDSAAATDETPESDTPSTSQEEPSSDLKGKFLIKSFDGEGLKNCMQCSKDETAKYVVTQDQTEKFLCSEVCLKDLTDKNNDNVIMQEKPAEKPDAEGAASAQAFSTEDVKTCADCGTPVTGPDNCLTWESLEFCDTKCLLKYQKKNGSFCVSCEKEVPEHFLGKYCVRFGYHIHQFCSSICLVKYKRGLKMCSYCQKEIPENTKGFVANIEKGQFRDFCGMGCLEEYKILKTIAKVEGSCAVCHKTKRIEIEYCNDDTTTKFCSEPCFVAFKYVNNIQPVKCGTCAKYYASNFLKLHVTCMDGQTKKFCRKICQIVFINMTRKIVSCGWCKVKKYNFDMIQKIVEDQTILMCSIPCLRLHEVTPKSTNKPLCNNCFETCRVTYHIANDGGMKNFCTYQCVQEFQSKQNPPLHVTDVPASGVPTIVKRVTRKKQIIPDVPGPLPIITSVRSLAPTANTQTEPPVKHIVFIKPPDLPEIRNVTTMVKPLTAEQETHIKPEYVDKETQTDRFNGMDIDIIPVPIYIPQPIPMYSFPFNKPTPFPLPIPIPILMPLTKNAASGILKEVKSAQPTPSDPYEADLLVMAQLVADANENKDVQEEAMIESDNDDVPADDAPYSPEPPEPTPTFGDDMLQMALNIATSFSEPAVDLEGALTASTITATASTIEPTEIVSPPRMVPERSASRGVRKRGRPARGSRGRGRGRSLAQTEAPVISAPVPEPPPETVEKPDANMCLKYTFGVNAWKQWVTNKNNDLEKTSRRPKLFKTELLQLTSDELNYSLCLFVKEVRKPNGAEYAPDTIYYLCLGIQQYLFENGRIDNIFCDPYYEQFTDCLDEICKKFSTLYNDSQYIVTRVEEEHLWESKQLGAHSPHVLLSTLMFFNTKHFNLTNVEEHMQLSFSHIMKHWKRMPSTPGSAKSSSSRNILLRFYPPQSAVEGKSKKKVYEQQENEDNPIRCPVKLYEFYLSKCPESVRTRNDVFYLQPERSCVPDSPVWYSTMALGTDSLEKMLHRVKMVKEINVALLAS